MEGGKEEEGGVNNKKDELVNEWKKERKRTGE